MAAEVAAGSGAGGAARWPDRFSTSLPAAGAPADASRLAAAYYGRHERFEPIGATELVAGWRVLVFRFAYSTAVAD
ncbi:DUF5988 family protein [Streptomyces alanosinicus]|uniref:Uncharacterized protein n=1 Tax=Streptomyces alanosinicus TaxID=68171 RepID=A0A918YSY4_9ACTN|nr:hypothetical protein GCM10010339_86290 [Streptomyces alanosinicus]